MAGAGAATMDWGASGSGRLRSRDQRVVDEAAIDTFAEALQGVVLRSGDAGYDEARRVWNASVDRHPGLIARCQGTADVVQAVRFARDHDLLVSVRGGGHNIAGRAVCDDGLMIDLSLMRGVFVDPVGRMVRAQGGALLGDLDHETQLHGLAVPSGVVAETGIGGLCLGGGVGWLGRKYGMTCDNLLGCEVVLADGSVVTADETDHADLFWAVRGGGGNFGIVTSFLLRAYPVTQVLGGGIFFPLEEAATVLKRYRDMMLSVSDDLTAVAGVVATPEGTPAVAVFGCWSGDMDEGRALFDAVKGFGTPIFEMVQPMPFLAMQQLGGSMNPKGMRNYWQSLYVEDLNETVIAVFVDHARHAPSSGQTAGIQLFSGAVTRVDETATAFAQRRNHFGIQIEAKWSDPADDERHIAWAKAFSAALRPFSISGHMLNFIGGDDDTQVRAAFGRNLPRLATLKARYDPTNFFSMNHNIRPAKS